MSETATAALIVFSIFMVIVGGSIWLVLAADRATRRRQAEFREAVGALGLIEDPSAVANGWKFLARGTYQGVALAVGERAHSRMTPEGPRTSNCVEVAAMATSDLGRYRLHHRFLSAPHVIPALRAGDHAFDNQFVIVPTDGNEERSAPNAFSPGTSLAQTPWLDETTRNLLLASLELQELGVHDKDVSLILRWYERNTFQKAVELALRLARWPTGTDRGYR